MLTSQKGKRRYVLEKQNDHIPDKLWAFWIHIVCVCTYRQRLTNGSLVIDINISSIRRFPKYFMWYRPKILHTVCVTDSMWNSRYSALELYRFFYIAQQPELGTHCLIGSSTSHSCKAELLTSFSVENIEESKN